jgi:hypothetical protein
MNRWWIAGVAMALVAILIGTVTFTTSKGEVPGVNSTVNIGGFASAKSQEFAARACANYAATLGVTHGRQWTLIASIPTNYFGALIWANPNASVQTSPPDVPAAMCVFSNAHSGNPAAATTFKVAVLGFSGAVHVLYLTSLPTVPIQEQELPTDFWSAPTSALPPIPFAALPSPSGIHGCPVGFVWLSTANPASALCIPYAYVPGGTQVRPNGNTACPADSHMAMGPALCLTDDSHEIAAPVAPASS